MTEEEWATCEDPNSMLGYLRGKVGDRKFCLFLIANARNWWSLLTDNRSKHALEVAESYVEGNASAEDLAIAENLAIDAYRAVAQHADQVKSAASEDACSAADKAYAATYAPRAAKGVITVAQETTYVTSVFHKDDCKYLCHVLRDIFGNPFRPESFDPSWITPTVTILARQMYDARDFTAMPILADALQDAGCADDQILSHSRGPGPHVRGCFVVDLLLGKS